MASNSTPLLETRLRVDDTKQGLTIAYFQVGPERKYERLEKMESVTITEPTGKREHLVTLKIALARPSELQGIVRFTLEREYEGRDIPVYLPTDIRYHVLMTSTAVFDMLEEYAS